MPTGRSWRELQPAEITRGLADLQALVAFRARSARGRSRRVLRLGLGSLALLTLASATVPAYVRDWAGRRGMEDLLLLGPTLYLAALALAITSAVAAGGGRELLPHEQTVAFPVSPVTEHFAALILTPLNLAWLLQIWTLLGVTAYTLGPEHLLATQLPVLLWILAATAIGQLVGWTIEGIRRGRHGVLIARGLALLSLAVAATVVITGRTATLLDASPTLHIYLGAIAGSSGHWSRWGWTVAVLAAIALAGVIVGLIPCRWALRRPQREAIRLESGIRRVRSDPASDLAAMVRMDRVAMWRSVPLRRGVAVLAVMPGLVAVAGSLEWRMIAILPGLVASGAALLFGVNAWALDGGGAMWRVSLPGSDLLGLWSKTIVMFEVLLVAGFFTLAVASLRAGVPTLPEVVAVTGATIVVTAQVVVRSLRWSIRSPYAVDLRSARATPAPPAVMAGYSARLALVTTITGLLFSGSAMAPDWRVPLLLTFALLLASALRFVRLTGEWALPQVRSRVVTTVAA